MDGTSSPARRTLSPWLWLTLLLAVLAAGCAGKTVKRSVEGNAFVSAGNPELRVDVPERFRYEGLIDVSSEGAYAYGYYASGKDYNTRYVFTDTSPAGALDAVIVVHVEQAPPGVSFYPDNLWEFADYDERVLDYGRENVDGAWFSTYTLAHSNWKDRRSALGRYFAELGHATPECMIMKRWGRLVLPRRDVLFSALYAEDPGLRGVSCSDLAYEYALSDETRAYLRGFEERARQSVRMQGGW